MCFVLLLFGLLKVLRKVLFYISKGADKRKTYVTHVRGVAHEVS